MSNINSIPTSVSGNSQNTQGIVSAEAGSMNTQLQTQEELTKLNNMFNMINNALQSIMAAVKNAWSGAKLT